MNFANWINSSVMAEEGECTHRAPCGRQIEFIRKGVDEQGRNYDEWGSFCACCGTLISSWREYEDPDLRGIHA